MGGHGTHKHVNESHIPHRVTEHMHVSESHVGMSHVTRMNNESCHTYESVTLIGCEWELPEVLLVHGLRYTYTRGWVTCHTISHSTHE